MEKDALTDSFDAMRFDLERSIRYWACRETFWRFVDHVCKLFIFVTSSGAVCIQAVDGNPSNTGWCAASAMATFLLESFAVQSKITFAVKQCQRYAALLTLFPIDETEQDARLLKRIRNERLMVEKDETIILDCLNVHCHNKQCVSENRLDDLVKLSFIERWVGVYLPIGFKTKA